MVSHGFQQCNVPLLVVLHSYDCWSVTPSNYRDHHKPVTPRFRIRASIKIIPQQFLIYVHMFPSYIYIYIYTYTHQISIIVPEKCWFKRPWCPSAQDLWHHFRPIPNPSLDIIKNSEKDNFSGSKSCGSQLVAHQETRGCKLSQPFSKI